MKSQVVRTIVLIFLACVLFVIGLLFANPQNAKWMDYVRGAAAGFGLAGCVSFLILLTGQLKQRRA